MNALSAGSDKICGLGEDGTAYCWGLFRLTVGDMVTRHVKPQATAIANWATDPEPEIEALRFVSISTGGQHACGVTLDGIARCWGDNSSYQLGIGGSGVFGGGVKPGGFEPERVKGDHRFAAVSAGRLHTCGVSRDGRAFCWGHNDLGQLGNGSTNEKDEPTLVTWEP
jgi:alpha-tubulin suppressor-like RCC1 family protein